MRIKNVIWTDHIRQVKILLVAMAVIIATVSLIVSNILVSDLKVEEENKMMVWAEAMRTLNTADENTDLTLVLQVINENNTIPVIVEDSTREIQTFRNVEINASCEADSMLFLKQSAEHWRKNGRSIRITLGQQEYIEVCYDESVLIKRLATYPYVQLGVVLLFVVIAIFALLTSKKAEQNKVWVGLSKETAHQLGTPISSLMAWKEILRETYPDDELIPEMEKDINRLQIIADRFSKIGSLPESFPTSLGEVITSAKEYMEKRISKQVIITLHCPEHAIIVNMNRLLFEWVIENLCKNAVDAIEGKGRIDLSISETPTKAIVEVADTGKGIRSKDLNNVFRPGFTTKKRGWGLGLSLAKRIVEDYHHGKIFVKSSEPGVGTVFRIEIRKKH